MHPIDSVSRSTFVENDHKIRVLEVAPAVYQDLREWRGSNTGRRPDNELCSVELNGFFNRTNTVGGVLTISEKAHANAGPGLLALIDRVLDRELPLPYPLSEYYNSVFVGEVIVEGYRSTRPWTNMDLPPGSSMTQNVWLTPRLYTSPRLRRNRAEAVTTAQNGENMSRHTTIVHSDRVETTSEARICMPGFANVPVDVKLTVAKRWPHFIKIAVTHALFHVEFDLDVRQLAHGRTAIMGSTRGFVRPEGDEVVIESLNWYWRSPVNIPRDSVDSFLSALEKL